MKKQTEIKNAKQEPKVYYCKHMVTGVAQYENERVLVTSDAIKNMCKSFEGKPVYVEHQEVDLENIQTQADGYVSDSFYCEADGWFWAKFVAVSDEAHEAISKGWAVSNAYAPTEWAGNGTCLNVQYDREVLNGEFNHLAIVPNPRYEEAEIMTPDEFKAYKAEKEQKLNQLKNSKDEPKKGLSKMKLDFWTKEPVTDLADLSTASHTLSNGKDVTIAGMIETLENAAKEEKEVEEKENAGLDMDAKVKVNGSEMTVKDLVNAYTEAMTKKENEAEAETEEEEASKKDAEAKMNAKETEEGKKHVDTLNNAIEAAKVEPAVKDYTSVNDKVSNGKKAY